jgi:hypothetical protein
VIQRRTTCIGKGKESAIRRQSTMAPAQARLIELVGEYGREQRDTASCTIKRRAIKGR